MQIHGFDVVKLKKTKKKMSVRLSVYLYVLSVDTITFEGVAGSKIL